MIGNFAPPLLVYWSSITYLEKEKIIKKIGGNGVPCEPKICHFDHIFSPHETISCSKISVDVVVPLKIGHAPAHLGAGQFKQHWIEEMVFAPVTQCREEHSDRNRFELFVS